MRLLAWSIGIALAASSLASAEPSARPRITFTGNAVFSGKQLLAAIDDPFDASGALVQEIFERDLLLVSAYYWDRGYARVKVGEPKITPTEIVIPITENERFSLGGVAVTGDPSPAMKARHRDALTARPGMVFSRVLIANDRQRLARYYEERGHAYVNVLPLTKIDLVTRTIDLTFEITRGVITHVEEVRLDCPRVPDAAAVMTVFPYDRYDVRTFEASKAAIMARGGLTKDDVVMWMKRGSADGQVILGFECH